MNIDDILRHRIIIDENFFNINIYCIVYICIVLFLTTNTFFYLNNKLNNILITTFIFVLLIYIIILFVNNKMMTNYYFAKKYLQPEKIVNQLNTGDIVFFRTYDYNSINQAQFLSLPLLQKTYFTHVGIIYKNSQNNVLIIESNAKSHKCKLFGKEKRGFQVMNFVDRVNTTKSHRVHVVKSNLHQFIDINKFYESVEKYKDYDFFQNGIYCLNLVTNILQENGILKENNFFPYMIDDLIEPKHYTVPVKFEEPILVKQYVK